MISSQWLLAMRDAFRAINDGRMAGLIDWDAIEDRTRNLVGNSHWSEPQSIIYTAARSYEIDKWPDQDTRVEIALAH